MRELVDNPPPGLIFRALSTRVRMRALAPPNALATRIDLYDPLDLYFSELRDDYLAGRVKVVVNNYKADERTIFTSFSIVASPPGEWSSRSHDHRARLLAHLAAQYKSAIARAATDNPKSAKRLRERTNKRLAGDTHPDSVDALFADQPAARQAASGIRALWQSLL